MKQSQDEVCVMRLKVKSDIDDSGFNWIYYFCTSRSFFGRLICDCCELLVPL